MTGIEVAAIALAVGARSAIRRRQAGPSPQEIVARAYLADQRVAQITATAIRELREMERRRQ
jgi:hypothetical protein